MPFIHFLVNLIEALIEHGQSILPWKKQKS